MDVEVTLKPGVSASTIVDTIESVQTKIKEERKEVKEVRVAFQIRPV